MDNTIPSRAPEPTLPVDDTGIDPDKNRIQKKAQVSLTCAQQFYLYRNYLIPNFSRIFFGIAFL